MKLLNTYLTLVSAYKAWDTNEELLAAVDRFESVHWLNYTFDSPSTVSSYPIYSGEAIVIGLSAPYQEDLNVYKVTGKLESDPLSWSSLSVFEASDMYTITMATEVTFDAQLSTTTATLQAGTTNFLRMTGIRGSAEHGDCALSYDAPTAQLVDIVGYLQPQDVEQVCGVMLTLDATMELADEITVTFSDGQNSVDVTITATAAAADYVAPTEGWSNNLIHVGTLAGGSSVDDSLSQTANKNYWGATVIKVPEIDPGYYLNLELTADCPGCVDETDAPISAKTIRITMQIAQPNVWRDSTWMFNWLRSQDITWNVYPTVTFTSTDYG